MFKSILITGGTGFFGQGFVRHVLDSNLSDRVCIFSRDEFKQAQMRDKFNDDRLRFFIGDARDQARLRRAMDGVDLVVHAAALKRIEVGHYNPGEMIKTNVIGSVNVIEAATDAGVKKVIFLSTDKAWNGRSPYGQTKALAESLFLAANNTRGANGPIFSCVRYGNVWGSTGSIVPRWRDLIANGATSVPVTDKNCTRFFMSLHDAVNLVLKTADEMSGGELVIPETLPAYRVGDLAIAMGVEMQIVGLPEFEKLHEGMRDGLTSDIVRLLTVNELKELLHDKEIRPKGASVR